MKLIIASDELSLLHPDQFNNYVHNREAQVIYVYNYIGGRTATESSSSLFTVKYDMIFERNSMI